MFQVVSVDPTSFPGGILGAFEAAPRGFRGFHGVTWHYCMLMQEAFESNVVSWALQKYFWRFQSALGAFQKYSRRFPGAFLGSSRGLSGVAGSFMCVSWSIRRFKRGVPWDFRSVPVCFRGFLSVSWVFQGVSWGFRGFKNVQGVFKGFQMHSRKFLGCFREFQELPWVFHAISRTLQKVVHRVLESSKSVPGASRNPSENPWNFSESLLHKFFINLLETPTKPLKILKTFLKPP